MRICRRPGKNQNGLGIVSIRIAAYSIFNKARHREHTPLFR
ncbi:hypothetical protein BH18THE2_BH18THE2_41680 [soil metagenome]